MSTVLLKDNPASSSDHWNTQSDFMLLYAKASIPVSYPSLPLLWMASSSVIPSSDLKASQSILDFSSVLILGFFPPIWLRMLPIPAGRFELQKGKGDMLAYKIMLHKNLDGSTTKNIILYFMSKTEIIPKDILLTSFQHWCRHSLNAFIVVNTKDDVYLYIFFLSVALKCFGLLKTTPEKYNPLK